MRNLPPVSMSTEYVSFKGGLDLESSTLEKHPGALDIGRNYVPESQGGYERIDGYERYSGQPSPSDATYFYVPVTLTGTVDVDDTITGADSSATGVVVVSEDGYLNITKVSGTFQDEIISVGGSPVGSITGDLVQTGESTIYLNAVALAAAADEYRGDIAAPVGSGPVRGLGLLKGVLYCFRNNDAGTAGLIYKATTSGWSAITLYSEISFTTGAATIPDGTAITQVTSGATATVKRTVQESGEWGSTAAGRLIIGSITGTFDATHEIQVGGVTKVTASSLATAITISPGGRYEIIEHNFYGSLDTKRLYGCDGVNRGFEFDGTVYVPIKTGMPTDKPKYVYAHKKQLFFSFKGSSQNSGVGTPYVWSAVSGSVEIALGDDITGYIQLPGKALAIFARNLSEQLLGNNVDDFVLDSISDEVGCIPRTVQRVGHAYCMDDRGIVRVYPTDKYGNFEQNTVSHKIQSIVNNMRSVVSASTVYRAKNQYRLYGSDGSGIAMTVLDGGGVGFGQFQYPDNIVCAVSGEDTTGKDVVFLGSDDGMVYQADKGSSFDGENIEAFIGLPFNHSKSPATIKTYKKASIKMTANGYTQLYFYPVFSDGSTEISEHPAQVVETESTGGYWDVANWDQFYYDGVAAANPALKIAGNGTNMSLTIYGVSKIDLGHKLDGVILHYIPRRMVR